MWYIIDISEQTHTCAPMVETRVVLRDQANVDDLPSSVVEDLTP